MTLNFFIYARLCGSRTAHTACAFAALVLFVLCSVADLRLRLRQLAPAQSLVKSTQQPDRAGRRTSELANNKSEQ
ncbi:MAG: hypothetical protein CMK07_05460 [Ponticaulis sp.]|nr:hypothetical protein [Ponticaulis sp.]